MTAMNLLMIYESMNFDMVNTLLVKKFKIVTFIVSSVSLGIVDILRYK